VGGLGGLPGFPFAAVAASLHGLRCGLRRRVVDLPLGQQGIDAFQVVFIGEHGSPFREPARGGRFRHFPTRGLASVQIFGEYLACHS